MRHLRPLVASALLLLSAPALPAQGAPPRPDARQALLLADARAGERSAREGTIAALRAVADDALAVLWEGAPLVTGKANALALLEAQPTLRGVRVQWQPLFAEVSRDSTVGLTWGVLTRGAEGSATPLRFARYLAGWRRGADGSWRLTALAWTGATRPDSTVLPPGLATGPREIPARARAVADADRAFAARGSAPGAAPAAFAEFAAPDAVTFGGLGDLAMGPAAIRAAFSPGGAAARWTWAPVHADASDAGDLGWTIGEAVIAPPGGGAGFRSKYLSLWVSRGGRVLWVADGGNSRP